MNLSQLRPHPEEPERSGGVSKDGRKSEPAAMPVAQHSGSARTGSLISLGDRNSTAKACCCRHATAFRIQLSRNCGVDRYVLCCSRGFWRRVMRKIFTTLSFAL